MPHLRGESALRAQQRVRGEVQVGAEDGHVPRLSRVTRRTVGCRQAEDLVRTHI